MKTTGRKKPKSAQAAQTLLPAIRIDANYLHGMALNVRQAIRECALPGLLEILVKEAKSGQMDAVFIPDVKGLNPITCCEALQPELHRLGMQTEIVRHQIPRLGMVEEKTALVVSWRNVLS